MAENEISKLLNEITDNNHKEVTVYALESCPACIELKEKLDKIGLTYENVTMDGNEDMWKQLDEMGGSDFAPQVQVEGYLIKENEYETVNELISKTLSNLLSRDIIIK